MAIKLTEIRTKIGVPTPIKSFRDMVIKAKDGTIAFEDLPRHLIPDKKLYWNIYSNTNPGQWTINRLTKLNFRLNPYAKFTDFGKDYNHNAQPPCIEVGSPIFIQNGSANVNMQFYREEFKIANIKSVQAYIDKWLGNIVDVPQINTNIGFNINISGVTPGIKKAGVYFIDFSGHKLKMDIIEQNIIFELYSPPALEVTIEPEYEWGGGSPVAIIGYSLSCNLNEKLTSDLVINGSIRSIDSKGNQNSWVNIKISDLTIAAASTSVTKYYTKRTSMPVSSSFYAIKAFVTTNNSGIHVESSEALMQ